MTPEQICQLLRAEFDGAVTDVALDGVTPYVVVAADRWSEVAAFLCNDARTGLSFLRSITSLDLIADNKLACVYHMMSLPADRGAAMITDTSEFAVRVLTDRDAPVIPTVAGVWAAADWHEREAYDLMGIVFEGHPDMRRILCPEDWVGYPLRKDYEFPLEYHGIPGTTEYELENPVH